MLALTISPSRGSAPLTPDDAGCPARCFGGAFPWRTDCGRAGRAFVPQSDYRPPGRLGKVRPAAFPKQFGNYLTSGGSLARREYPTILPERERPQRYQTPSFVRHCRRRHRNYMERWSVVRFKRKDPDRRREVFWRLAASAVKAAQDFYARRWACRCRRRSRCRRLRCRRRRDLDDGHAAGLGIFDVVVGQMMAVGRGLRRLLPEFQPERRCPPRRSPSRRRNRLGDRLLRNGGHGSAVAPGRDDLLGGDDFCRRGRGGRGGHHCAGNGLGGHGGGLLGTAAAGAAQAAGALTAA